MIVTKSSAGMGEEASEREHFRTFNFNDKASLIALLNALISVVEIPSRRDEEDSILWQKHV